MAYSPSVQYEGYKRLDFALSASSFFLFSFFCFDFATLKKNFFFFSPLQNSFHRLPGSVVGHKVWANAQQQHVVPTEFRRLW